VRDVLTQSVISIRRMKQAQPETYLSLGVGLAEVQFELGLHDDALILAQELYALSGNTDQPVNKLRSQRLVIQALVALGRYQLAEQEINIAIQNGNAIDPAILVARAQLVTVQKQPEHALKLIDQALKQLRPDPINIVWVNANLRKADALRVNEQPDLAARCLDELVSQLSTSVGATHVYTIRARLFRADQLRRMQRIQPALQEGKDLIKLVTLNYGDGSSFSGRAYASLASALIADQQYAASIPHLEKALDAYVLSLGPYNRTTLNTRFNLAQMMATSNRFDVATFAQFERSISDAELNQQHIKLATFFRSQYASTLTKRKRADVALTVLTDGLTDAHISAYTDAEKRDYLEQVDENLVLSACGTETHETIAWTQRCALPLLSQAPCKEAIKKICQLASVQILLRGNQ
jgi:tetratricopeptide (TPR) repeat protein